LQIWITTDTLSSYTITAPKRPYAPNPAHEIDNFSLHGSLSPLFTFPNSCSSITATYPACASANCSVHSSAFTHFPCPSPLLSLRLIQILGPPPNGKYAHPGLNFSPSALSSPAPSSHRASRHSPASRPQKSARRCIFRARTAHTSPPSRRHTAVLCPSPQNENYAAQSGTDVMIH
jgi:hypothetical protein